MDSKDNVEELIHQALYGEEERKNSVSVKDRHFEAYLRQCQIESGDASVPLDYLYLIYREWSNIPNPFSYGVFVKYFKKHFQVKSKNGKGPRYYYAHLNTEKLNIPDHYRYKSDPVEQAVKKYLENPYLGVYKLSKRKYIARLLLPTGEYLPLGTHSNAVMAAVQYDLAALQIYGKEAVLNFPKRWRRMINEKKDFPKHHEKNFHRYFYKKLARYKKFKEEQDQNLKPIEDAYRKAEDPEA